MKYYKKFFYRAEKGSKRMIPHPPYFWMSISWILFITSIVVKLIFDDKNIDGMIGILATLCGGVTTWYRMVTRKKGGHNE